MEASPTVLPTRPVGFIPRESTRLCISSGTRSLLERLLPRLLFVANRLYFACSRSAELFPILVVRLLPRTKWILGVVVSGQGYSGSKVSIAGC
jgi:hypothetical protein